VTEKKLQHQLPAPLESFTRRLLATTGLTVACGVSAVAGTITEGTSPAPADFPNTSPGYALPGGTNLVIGAIGSRFGESGNFDSADWFVFSGLTAGATMVITGLDTGLDPFEAPPRTGENGLEVDYFNSSLTSLGSLDIGEFGGFPGSNLFVVPGDGQLLVDVQFHTGESGNLPAWTSKLDSYQVSIGSATPEPGTLGAVGVGLGAIALAWRRRRAK
jgi:hypothetical protein